MNDLAQRGPIGLKAEKVGKPPRKPMRKVSKKRAAYRASEQGQEDTEYLDKVRALPCVICHEWGLKQNSPTEAHHSKSGRYGSLKTSDKMAIPLCHSHHNKLRPYPGDEDKFGFHNAQATWERQFGMDYDWISWVEKRIGRD